LALIAFLLLTPLGFLLFKTMPYWSGSGHLAKDNIAQLETKTRRTPSYSNYLNLGVAYINNNKPAESLAPLAEARRLKPNSAVVYNNLGVAYLLLKRYDEGIAACRRAIELDPNFQLAKNNLNWGLTEQAERRRPRAR
jgi:tetratricopeptide (TPR) repeat protein